MATYLELRGLFNHSDLRNRVEMAIVVAANEIRKDPTNYPTTTADNQLITDRKTWAARAIQQTEQEARKAVMVVLAENKDAAVGDITSATKILVQPNVDAVVDLLAQYGA